jgi:hypothetical protein
VIDAVPYMQMCEDYSKRVAELEQAIADLLPYARASIGATWLANPPQDSVIVQAERLIAHRGDATQ